jgi:TatD DNase family protein
MNSNLIDTHCHINFFKNAGDIALKCERKKVHTIYVTTLPSQFEETYPYVKNLKYIYPSLGFHCLEHDYDLNGEKKIFLKNIDKSRYIGEVGLDFSKRAIVNHDVQIEILEFIFLSIQYKDKIVSVHSASAEDKVFELLQKYEIRTVIFHWYSGKISTLKKILETGYFFSINQAMCKSKKGQNIISKLPKDKVLIETDAPFIKDVLPYENDFVYSYLSDIWNISLIDVKKKVLNNFIKMICS